MEADSINMKMKRVIKKIKGKLPDNDFAKLPTIVSLLLVAIGVFLSYIFANILAQRSEEDFQIFTRQESASMTNHVSSQLEGYEQMLLNMTGLFGTNDSVSQADWKSFIEAGRIVERYPSMLGIGYTVYIPKDQKELHEDTMRQRGRDNYRITPTSERDEYTAIIYSDPDSVYNRRAIGYDMFSESNRRQAMSKARDTGTVQMSAPVHLVQDEDDPSKRGVLIYYPIYQNDAPAKTVEQRREALRGYVYVVVRPTDIIASINEDTIDASTLSYEVKDMASGEVVDSRLATKAENAVEYDVDREIDMLGRKWSFAFTTYQPTFQRFTGPGILLLLGTALSFIVGFTVYKVLKRAFDEMIISHEESLMQTKNDLLALASHQLRTPASGVKQYLGLLTQGFMGDLTEEQYAIAKKAYNSNERQLETINQILHVAKADANQLSIEPQLFDLAEIVRDICEGMDTLAKQKNITLVPEVPETCMVEGDERYIRMAAENLVSNAIKYSHEGTQVNVGVVQTSRNTRLYIRDEGVGIDKDDIERLFHKFSRIDNPLSRREGGTGLGLFLANHIAREHGGMIAIESTLGKGSVFTIVLPNKFKGSSKKNKRR